MDGVVVYVTGDADEDGMFDDSGTCVAAVTALDCQEAGACAKPACLWYAGKSGRTHEMGETMAGTETIGPDHGAHEVVHAQGAHRYSFAVSLMKRDPDRGIKGGLPPARMVDKALQFLFAPKRLPAILATFNCAVTRRYFPETDREQARLR